MIVIKEAVSLFCICFGEVFSLLLSVLVCNIMFSLFFFCSLIVVGRPHPTPIVLALIDYVSPSRPVAIFSQNQEVNMSILTPESRKDKRDETLAIFCLWCVLNTGRDVYFMLEGDC